VGSDVKIRTLKYAGPDSRAMAGFLRKEAASMNRGGTMQDFAELLAGVLQANVTFVAEDGKKFVGFASLKRGSGPAEHAGTVRVHVTEKQRAGGVGSQLLTALLEWADEKGLERVVATPYVKDWSIEGTSCTLAQRKVAFFEKHGFTVEGRATRFARLLDGSFTDAALMARVRA
jgi:GNAT superfamily N-acetyltransferase